MENREPFGTFWNLYPIRKNVVAARESWRIAIKKVSPEMILEAVEKYANDPHRDPSYTPFPARWLDEERWHDGPTPPRTILHMSGFIGTCFGLKIAKHALK